MSPRELAVQSKPIELMSMADAIRLDLAAGDAGYRAAGEKFIKQKESLQHGEWLPWLKKEGFTETTAKRYMAYAKSPTGERYADWLDQQEPSRQKPSPPRPTVEVPTTKAPKEATTESLPMAKSKPGEVDDEDGVEPGDETTRVLPETEPPVTQQNTVKAPANEQPTPKKFRLGSSKWVEEQVGALYGASSNLRSVYPKLTRYQRERVAEAQKGLEHVVQIGADFERVNQVSSELIQMWNQQAGDQVEVDGYLMRSMKEAVAYAPYIRTWKQVVEAIYAAQGSAWFTTEHFEWLTETRHQSDLDDLEKEWGTPPHEAVEAAAGTPGTGS